MKHFIITVDTEGDNLWEYKKGTPIGTENAKYLPRFQSLCEKYGFKPVYLTNYEMASSDTFVTEAKKWLDKGNCEIGVHLHAWNNPPLIELPAKYDGNPYLIEYSDDVMRQKFDFIYNMITARFGIKPVSHRAGRWAMDDRYFRILEEYGILVDCSHTPSVDWSKSMGSTQGGSDYTNVPNQVHNIGKVLEVPPTLRFMHHALSGSFKHRIKTLVKGEPVWLRPALESYSAMKKVVDIVNKEPQTDYLEFMIHSAEMMPGGSPYFRTEDSIEKMYLEMESFFKYVSELGYKGCTLKEYYEIKIH